MKTTMKSMMIIGMMSLCTVSTFGKSNTQPRDNNQPRQEVRVEHKQDKHMDKRHDDGKVYRMEPVRHNDPKPVPQPQPEPRHHNGNDITTGVVIGTVVGTVLSSLIH